MFQRTRRNPQSRSEVMRTTKGDPWGAATEPRTSDQPIWILSYLDVMMILFAFFVLLFAYQKALLPVGDKAQSAATSQTNASARAANRTAMPQPTPDRAPALAETASAPKMPPAYASLSRELGKPAPVSEPEPAVSRAVVKDSVASAARLASAQTGQWISQALQKETESKQVQVVTAGRGVRLELSESIFFGAASADLNPGGADLLDRVLPILSQQPGILLIEGHTDSIPIANSRFPSNWELSTARASAVTRYLIGRGIPSDRLRAVGLADTHPRAANESPEGRATNRRVSLVLGSDY